MFLALDESFSQNYTTIGCILLPLDLLPDLEKNFTSLRITENVWGEIKWENISKTYNGKYKKFIEKYLLDNLVTFHSWTYKNPSSQEINEYFDGKKKLIIYKQAYLLIRSVIRKCLNNGFRGEFYIVPDESGKLGSEEYKVTEDLLENDTKIYPKPKIQFCNQGNSAVVGALQITDVCTGATRFAYESCVDDSSASQEIVDFITKINQGIPINTSYPTLPKLNQFKIHHYLYHHD